MSFFQTVYFVSKSKCNTDLAFIVSYNNIFCSEYTCLNLFVLNVSTLV